MRRPKEKIKVYDIYGPGISEGIMMLIRILMQNRRDKGLKGFGILLPGRV